MAGELGLEPAEQGLVVEALIGHGYRPALRRRPVAEYLDQRLLVRPPSCSKFPVSAQILHVSERQNNIN